MVWPGPELAGEADGAGDVDARRAAEARGPLRQKVEDDRHRLVVRDLVGAVDRRAFEVGGDPALADALGDRGALGLQLAGRVVGDRAPRPSDRRARSDVGLRSLSAMPTPASVPPVPTAQMKPSTLPSVCSQISGPVVS